MPVDNSNMTCYGCGKKGHYANKCMEQGQKPPFKACNYALQTGHDNGEEAEVPVSLEDKRPEEVRDAKFPNEDEYPGGNQYDPDDVFVLEDLEEDPANENDVVCMGAVDEEVHLGMMTQIQDTEDNESVLAHELLGQRRFDWYNAWVVRVYYSGLVSLCVSCIYLQRASPLSIYT
jgi:hypothetical protein